MLRRGSKVRTRLNDSIPRYDGAVCRAPTEPSLHSLQSQPCPLSLRSPLVAPPLALASTRHLFQIVLRVFLPILVRQNVTKIRKIPSVTDVAPDKLAGPNTETTNQFRVGRNRIGASPKLRNPAPTTSTSTHNAAG